jgi:hypothetical protein
MLTTVRLIAGLSFIFAGVCLFIQGLIAWHGGRKDYSVPTGSPMKGISYNFTIAMLPSHKETILRFPGKYVIGILLHIGTFIAIMEMLILIFSPTSARIYPLVLTVMLSLAFLCGLYLLVRRIISAELRYISCPDDYLAIFMTIVFIALAALNEVGIVHPTSFLLFGAVLFFYMPFGKLRHALFFFIARADFGRRLGYRGVYPAIPHQNHVIGKIE